MLPRVQAAREAMQANPAIPIAELISRFGIGVHTVYRLRKSLGIRLPQPKLLGSVAKKVLAHPEMSGYVLAKICGVSRQRIYQIRNAYHEKNLGS